MGLQSSDAADTAQDVFQAVFQKIGHFRGGQEPTQPRSGSFRGWLWTITRNQVRLKVRRQKQEPKSFGYSEAQEQIREQTGDAVDDEPPEALTTRQRIVQRALQNVRGDFSPQTWEIFVQTSLQHRSNAEVAADMGISENSVRQSKFRVLRRLREELAGEF